MYMQNHTYINPETGKHAELIKSIKTGCSLPRVVQTFTFYAVKCYTHKTPRTVLLLNYRPIPLKLKEKILCPMKSIEFKSLQPCH